MAAGKLFHIVVESDQQRVVCFCGYADQFVCFCGYADQFVARAASNDILKGYQVVAVTDEREADRCRDTLI